MLDFVIAFTKTFAADARVKSTFLQQKEGNLYHFFFTIFHFLGLLLTLSALRDVILVNLEGAGTKRPLTPQRLGMHLGGPGLKG